MTKAAKPARGGTVRSTIVYLSCPRHEAVPAGRPLLASSLPGNPKPVQSLVQCLGKPVSDPVGMRVAMHHAVPRASLEARFGACAKPSCQLPRIDREEPMPVVSPVERAPLIM